MGLQKSSDWLLFLSTPSVGRATSIINKPRHNISNFYPRPPWGGRPRPCPPYRPQGQISIHALRGEGDCDTGRFRHDCGNFYPRPPWGGRQLSSLFNNAFHHFYPRPPWGGRQTGQRIAALIERISIHALRGEGDIKQEENQHEKVYFYPRPPRGGRRDSGAFLKDCANFYPRSPRGGRPRKNSLLWLVSTFLSTPSAGRATNLVWPVEGRSMDFYPRPPRGGRP